MPTRVLRDWTDSAKFDGISAEAERLFVRLIMKADDFGRFHAHPKLVKSACFPLAEDLRANTVAAWLTELSDRHLVFSYTSGTGQYLAIINFGQRIKDTTVSKFPAPPGESDRWLPDGGAFPDVHGFYGTIPEDPGRSGMIPDDPGKSGTIPLKAEAEAKAEAKAKAEAGNRPPPKNAITEAQVLEALGRSTGSFSELERDIFIELSAEGVTIDDIRAAFRKTCDRGKPKKFLSYLQEIVREVKWERENPGAKPKKGGKSNHDLSGKDYLAGIPG